MEVMFHEPAFGPEFRDTFGWNYTVGGTGFCTYLAPEWWRFGCGTWGKRKWKSGKRRIDPQIGAD